MRARLISFLFIVAALIAAMPKSTGSEAAMAAVARLTKPAAVDEARKALRQTYGKRWTHGRQKRLGCRATSDDAFRCRASWKYSGEFLKRTLLVVDRGESISVSIFSG
jgi:hypothetical protein